MAELLSPVVAIEERASSIQVIQPVSTSNFGTAGWTPKGPAVPTLVTSFTDFTNKFGPIVKESMLGLTMAAYYNNGGKRAFIQRVTPLDATLATATVKSKTVDQIIATGDGITATVAAIVGFGPFKVNLNETPIVAESVSIRWRGQGAAVAGEIARDRNNLADLTTVNGVGGRQNYEGRLRPVEIDSPALGLSKPAFVEKMYVAVPGSVTVNWDGKFIAVASTAAVATATTADGTVIFDHRTGRFSLKTAVTPAVAGNVTVDYTPVLGDQGDRAVATLVGGGGPNGNVYLLVDDTGVAGNSWTVEIIDTTTVISQALTAQFATGTTNRIQVLLGTDGLGVLDPVLNTALLVAAAINALVGVSAVQQGTGATAFTAGEGPVTFTGGRASADYWQIIDTPVGLAPYVTGTLNSSAGLTGPGTIKYRGATDAGQFTFTTDSTKTLNVALTAGTASLTLALAPDLESYSAVPHNFAPVLTTYEIDAYAADLVSKGAYGNDIRLRITGTSESAYYTPSTGQYARFDVAVLSQQANGSFLVLETFDETVFSDSTSSVYWVDVVNELSDYIVVTDNGVQEPVGQLQAVARTMVLAGGDAQASTRVITATLAAVSIAPRTVSIAYTDINDVAHVITDNGRGVLVSLDGGLDGTYSSPTIGINYDTGFVDFQVAVAIKGGTLVVATYASAAEEVNHNDDFAGGADGTFDSTNYGRNQFTNPLLIPTQEGLYGLDKIDELMQVALPDFAGDTVVTGDMIDYAESHAAAATGADRFLILTTPQGMDPQEAVDWLQIDLGRNTMHAALYWPWLRVADPLSNGRPLPMPSMGHVAGIYARTDNNKNVGKSPGGTVDGKLNFLIDLEFKPNLEHRNFVYPRKINPFIDTTQTGKAVWGVRTLAGPGESDFRYINARRTFNFVERSTYNSTHWIVFENNGPALWAKISGQLSGFLRSLFGDGILAGTTASQAFFVTVDQTNNTPDTINQGKVIIDVGLAINKPAEFVQFRFSQISGT